MAECSPDKRVVDGSSPSWSTMKETEPKFQLGQKVRVVSIPSMIFTIAGMYWSHGEWIYHNGDDSGWRGYETWGEEDDLELE